MCRTLNVGKWELQAIFFISTNVCTLALYKQLFLTDSVLLLLSLSTVLGFPLYEDTVMGGSFLTSFIALLRKFGLARIKFFWWASLVKQGSNKILPKVSRLFNGPSAQPTEPGRQRAVGIRSLHPYRSRSLGQRTQTSRICQTTVECFQRLAGSTFSGGATPPSLQGPAGSARRPCRTRHSSWATGTTRADSRGPSTGSATAPTFGAGVRRGSQQESGTPLLCTNLEIELWNPSKDGSGHSGFGSNLDQFSSKLKCNLFFKIVTYGQIRASRYKLLNLIAFFTS